jgi:hypothetical protein
MGKIGLTEIIFVLLIIAPTIYSIVLLLRSLKKENLGFSRLGDAAQELNNKTLHQAAESLFESNKIKYQIIFIVFFQFVFSLLLGAIAML